MSAWQLKIGATIRMRRKEEELEEKCVKNKVNFLVERAVTKTMTEAKPANFSYLNFQ